jgi:TolB protein
VTEQKYAGHDGFFRIDAMDGESIDSVAAAEAYHVLRPYGSWPTIEVLLVQGQDARLILPSADQPAGMDDQAALIARTPRPIQPGSEPCRYLVLYADTGHIRAIGETLRFTIVLDPEPPQGMVVDDGDDNFFRYGISTSWRRARMGYGADLIWTRNNDQRRSGYNWARWQPELAPGHYEVLAYIPRQYATTKQARYWVSHWGGYTMRIVDQSANAGRWVSLGSYMFRGTSTDHVSLSDVTYEPYLSTLIGFDAVKWVPLR